MYFEYKHRIRSHLACRHSLSAYPRCKGHLGPVGFQPPACSLLNRDHSCCIPEDLRLRQRRSILLLSSVIVAERDNLLNICAFYDGALGRLPHTVAAGLALCEATDVASAIRECPSTLNNLALPLSLQFVLRVGIDIRALSVSLAFL